jgi:predicted nucleic acid-binding protein
VVFLDTNIWFYVFVDSQSLVKHTRAKQLIESEDIVLSQQVVSEVCNALIRKAPFTEEQIKEIIRSFYTRYRPMTLVDTDLISASDLRQNYRLSYWDSLIVAAALKSNSTILYSEDMQDGLVVENRLTIQNPFN